MTATESGPDDLVGRSGEQAAYRIVFISREAETGWKDGLAADRAAIVDAWERLRTAPAREDGHQVCRLKARLALGLHRGQALHRYLYVLAGGGRIWYFIDHASRTTATAGQVLIEDVHIARPTGS